MTPERNFDYTQGFSDGLEHDHFRVDVFGRPISVRGAQARELVEALVHENARLKLALHKVDHLLNSSLSPDTPERTEVDL